MSRLTLSCHASSPVGIHRRHLRYNLETGASWRDEGTDYDNSQCSQLSRGATSLEDLEIFLCYFQVILSCRFEETRVIFWEGQLNFEPRSDDEDDIRDVTLSTNFRTSPEGGRLAF
ncbi:hypothetical protein AVEN_63631-1 [Araneus ventricosus]|uniref:Uncharacterized protein n=1 Tax=Araneus ventricosus TaxID=182803 RepID=A0A4Y2VN49_ARAVE|nr:hypothetical protein AVEN_63631-1 [Araneus ventricosus]